jgi:anaerobic magnesium-protoporphyrin IX monomethyl ester cyclase
VAVQQPPLDCLILGFYDYPFPEYVEIVRAMGERSGAYRDLALSFVELKGKPYRALDVVTALRKEEMQIMESPFHNADFLWPVVVYLSSYLQRHGFTTDYVNLPHLAGEDLGRKLQSAVRAVAITTTLYVSPLPIIELIKQCRRWNPTARVIVGGPFVSTLATSRRDTLTAMLGYINADIYVLCNEGEATLAATLQALQNDTPLSAIPNLAFRLPDRGFAFTDSSPEANALAENPIDYAQFTKQEIGQFVTTRTAKSCPFSCAFCAFPTRAGRYTYLDVNQVEKLFDAIEAIGTVTTVTIIDDTFNVPKGRFKEILRMMARKRYRFKWNCFYRCDHGDDEAIEMMAAAGCEGVFLGAESGSDTVLERMNKSARRSHYARAIPRLNEVGISTYASFIVGFPGETPDTIRETIDLIEEAKPEYYRAQLWYADPVTPIWRERERYSIEGVGFDWKHNSMNAAEACGWVEEMFLTIKNSTWMPQFGFEQWSTFYLQRRGMTREQVRQFVRSFNAVVRHQVTNNSAATPELLETLRECCRFDAVPTGKLAN